MKIFQNEEDEVVGDEVSEGDMNLTLLRTAEMNERIDAVQCKDAPR